MTKKSKVGSVKKKVTVVLAPKPKKKSKRAKASLRGWGGTIGGALGGYLGGPGGAATGGMLGRSAGALISKISGFGDYRVNKNSIVQGNSVPTFKSDGDGMVICHREFLFDVIGSPGFSLVKVPINPGLPGSFPLLSRILSVFEEYELVGLVYEYRPSSGSAVSSASSALGVVILATDYDAANPDFSNKQQMESYEYSTSTVPFTGCIHPVECARMRNVLDNLYVRTGPPPVGTDIRLYDMGNFQIATQGMQSVYTVGECWVSYDVRGRKPRLLPSVSDPLFYMRVITTPANMATEVNQFGAPIITSDSNLDWYGFSNIPAVSFSILFKKKGTFAFFYNLRTTAGSLPGYTGVIGGNLAVNPKILLGNTSAATVVNVNILPFPLDNVLSTYQIITVTADGVGLPNTYIFQNNPGIWSGANSDLHVWRLSDVVPLTIPRALDPVMTSINFADFSRLSIATEGCEEKYFVTDDDSLVRL